MRETGGNSTGCGVGRAAGGSRRGLAGRGPAGRICAGRYVPVGRCIVPGRCGNAPGRPWGVAGRTGWDGSGRGPPIIAGVVPAAGRAVAGYGDRAAVVAGRGGAGAGAAARGAGGCTLGGCWMTARRGWRGGADGGAFPGSSTRSRMLGGTNRPGTGAGWAASPASPAGLAAASSTNAAASTGRSIGPADGSAATAGKAISTGGSGVGAAIGGTAGAGVGGAGGLTVLINRGGGSEGAAGLTGSVGTAAFLPDPPTRLTVLAAASEKMSPFGSSIPRWRARRSTNCRATISSSVLDALFSSMP